MNFGTLLGGVGALVGSIFGGGGSGLGQAQASMAQTQQQQMAMFQLQQQADAFSEKMQTLASIEKSMDDTVKTMAQDIK